MTATRSASLPIAVLLAFGGEPTSLCYCLTEGVAWRPPRLKSQGKDDESGLRRRTDELCNRSPVAGLSLTFPARSPRDALDARQSEPDFWTNQEKARGVIGQLKVANSLLKPYEELNAAAGEIRTMAELAEDDPSFEAEIEPALVKAEQQYESFETSRR